MRPRIAEAIVRSLISAETTTVAAIDHLATILKMNVESYV